PGQVLPLVTDAAEIRSVELTPSVGVRLTDRELAGQVAGYLGMIGSNRVRDRRRMTIAAVGDGERDLLVSYISEVPVWKTTYRIVLPESGKPLLQGWAIVDNTIGEDWTNVELSLVAGAPQSFIQQLSQPMYARRPIVAVSQVNQSTPQTHGETFADTRGQDAAAQRDAVGGLAETVTVTGSAQRVEVSGFAGSAKAP